MPRKAKLIVDSPDGNACARFGGSKCIVLISMANPHCDGQHFEAMLTSVCKAGFVSCAIVVADTLQRHALRFNHPTATEEDRKEIAIQNGRNWVARNGGYIARSQLNYQLIHGDQLLSDAYYAACREELTKSFEQDTAVSGAFESFVDEFLNRSGRNFDSDLCEQLGISPKLLSLTYAMEETAVFKPYFAANGYTFIVYPRPLPVAFR